MMKTTLTFALALGLAVSVAAPLTPSTQAAEDSAPAPADAPRHPADLNDDGKITADEFEKFHKDLFAKADANTDGQLDADEMPALSKRLHGRKGSRHEMRSFGHEDRKRTRPDPEEFFTTYDANQDGKLEPSEVPEPMARRFDRLDANGDGAVTLEEFREGKPNRKEMRKRFEERFWSMDANGDGMIQKSEATGRLVEKFDAMDANTDGAIDKEELETLRSKFQRHGSKFQRHGRDDDDDHPRRNRRSGETDGEPAES